MKIGVLGGGESGVGAALLAKEKGHVVLVSDYGVINKNYKKELKDNNIRFEESGHTLEILENLDLIVKSPGIPNTSKIIQKLRNRNVRIIGELEFGFLQCSGKIIAITGTNGKTTTTNLTFDMLKSEGYLVAKGGNIGNSFCRLVIEDSYDWYVLEVSSFQLDDISQFRPDIACVLNVTPDHLDRYNYSMDEYRNAKVNIGKNMTTQDVMFVGNDQELIKATQSLNVKIAVVESYSNKILNNPFLRGQHNALNVAFAQKMSEKAGVKEENIDLALESFENDDHRLQPVARINEVLYINDSKATNVEAVYYALTAFEDPIIWIAGGVDKGNDYSKIEKKVGARVKGIVVLGEDDNIEKYFKSTVKDVKKAKNMAKAIKKASKMTEQGDVVLLSPACASFDLFDNYKERGKKFIEEVWKLID